MKFVDFHNAHSADLQHEKLTKLNNCKKIIVQSILVKYLLLHQILLVSHEILAKLKFSGKSLRQLFSRYIF